MEVDDDPETAEEEEKFKKGPEMRSLARTISQRLQLDVSDLHQVIMMGVGGSKSTQPTHSVADPVFPRRDANPWGGQAIFWPILPENCMKMKNFWARGGRASLAPPRSANALSENKK